MLDLRDQLQATLGAAYTIERELGGGGMARVFVATETALGRTVVIKVLPPEMRGAVTVERFRREVLLAARLRHAHLVPLLSAGDADGVPYFTMPFVEGESLRARLARDGALPIAEAVRLLRDVSDALAHAHREGFVHRDLKPENILLEHGHAFVADFGVAKALTSAATAPPTDGTRGVLTTSGLAVGTPAYMAPEQVLADPGADHRVDLYALGCVAYEMLAGGPLFGGTTPHALVAAHIAQMPQALAARRSEVPADLSALVMRLLEKRPEDRPQSAADVLETLERLDSRSGLPQRLRSRRIDPAARTRWAAAVGALLVVTLIAAGVVLATRSASHRPESATTVVRAVGTRPAITAVAVLPLVNVGGSTDGDYFADGMTDELAGALADVEGLRVAARSSAFALKGTQLDAAALGRALNVGALLEGSVRRAGGRLRVATQLVSAADGLTLWSHSYEREERDVFAVQDEIARAVANALSLALRGGGAVAGEHPANAEAHDLYLRGLYHFRKVTKPELLRSVAFYEQALARDSTYALAWAALAVSWETLADDWVAPGEAYPKAKVAAERALSLDPRLPTAHTARGGVLYFYEWKPAEAEREFLRALALSASTPEVGLFYSDLLASTGRADSALALARRSHAADPLYVDMSTQFGDMLRITGRADEALAVYRAALDLEPNRSDAWQGIGDVLAARGRRAEALAAYRRLPGKGVLARVATAVTLVELGRRDEARRELAALVAESRRRYVRAEQVAAVYVALGERDSAFVWLDRALRDRSSGMMRLASPTMARYWDPIRADPRFRQLLREVGIT